MSAAPALQSVRKFTLEMCSGALEGEKFHFAKPSVTIGRGSENDIALVTDPKASRAHVEIRAGALGFAIHNVSEKNVVFVNGQSIRNTVVTSECKIQVGDTEIILRPEQHGLPVAAVAPLSTAYAPLTGYSGQPAFVAPFPEFNTAKPARAQNGGSRLMFYTIIAVVAVMMSFVLFNTIKKKPPQEIRTTEELEKDVGTSQETVAEIQKRLEAQGRNTPQYELAQEMYVRGFRDYRMKQYSRAVQSLQSALVFYPQHDLAVRYLSLAKRKLDEVVKAEMNLGAEYRASDNYRMCQASYEKVLRLINNDHSDVNYKEADQFKRECELQLKDHY